MARRQKKSNKIQNGKRQQGIHVERYLEVIYNFNKNNENEKGAFNLKTKKHQKETRERQRKTDLEKDKEKQEKSQRASRLFGDGQMRLTRQIVEGGNGGLRVGEKKYSKLISFAKKRKQLKE